MLDERKQFKSNIFLLIIIFIVISFCFWLWYIRLEYRLDSNDNKTIYSQTGYFDLSEFDFSKGIVITGGSEEYIESKLLNPEEFNHHSQEIKIGRSSDYPVNTSRITLYLPDNNTYTIMGNSFDFAERIYINGQFISEVGTVGQTAQTSSPGYEYLNFSVTPINGVVEIVRQSNNFVHRDNGVASHILIGTPEIMSNIRSVEYSVTGVMIGMFFAIAISHIFLFMLFEKHKAHLLFAVLSLTWAVRLGVTGIKVFSDLTPFLNWEFLFRLEYMTVPITSAMMLLVAQEIFPKALPKLFLNTYVGGFLLYAAACLFIPTIPLSYSMVYLQAIFIIGSILLFIFLIPKLSKLIKTKQLKINHLLFIIGYIPFLLSVTHDAFYYNGILVLGVNVLLIDLSLMVIVITQTAVIYYDSAKKMNATYKAEQEIRIEAASLRQAKKMHEDFLQTLSHEMQLPLTTISGYAQLTSQILFEDEDIDRVATAEKMRVIDGQARTLSRQVRQLLDASSMENGSFKLFLKNVTINELFLKITANHFPIMSDGNITLTTEIENDLPEVFSDEERLLQIILNIISNAIKHSDCTKITLSAKVCDTDSNFVSICVFDNGKGLPNELKKELFNRYPKNRSAKGNGLGLYIVSQAITAGGGKIYFESEENCGTKIIFTVPISKKGKDDAENNG